VNQIIASYLIQQKRCVLPGIGRLELIRIPATSDIVHRLLLSPREDLHISPGGGEDSDCIHYIARRLQLNYADAAAAFNRFASDAVAQMEAGQPLVLPGVGEMTRAYNGSFTFDMLALPQGLASSVTAERVIHPSATHQVLVGDRETTTTEMADYFAATPVTRQRWWIPALLLLTLAVGAIVYQVFVQRPDHLTGNSIPFTPAPPPVLHTILP
jgi:hypothetical protein